jgi:two-component system NtrC family sensor kinase
MTLKIKILLILTIVFSLYAAVEYGIQRFVVYPNFVLLENEEARRNIKHCVEALNREKAYLAVIASELAASDDIGKFMKDGNEEYLEGQSLPPYCRGEHIDFVAIYGDQDNLFWLKVHDPDLYDKSQIKRFLKGYLEGFKGTVSCKRDGILNADERAILVVSKPFINTIKNTKVSGTVILGKFVTDAFIERLAEMAGVDFRFSVIAGGNLTPHEVDVLSRLTKQSGVYINQLGDNLLQLYTVFENVDGKPGLLIRTHATKDFSAKGVQSMNATLLVMFVAGLSTVLVSVTLLQFVIITPINKLIRHFIVIGRNEDTSARLSMSRRDEIGTLAREFDRMVERLDEARKKLLEKSYLSGMAEMSSAVLHNARNSLSPILTCIDRLRQQFKEMPLGQIEMAQVELAGEEVSAQRWEDLDQFINLASKSVFGVLKETQANLEDLGHQVSQMEAMLAGQKTFREVERPMESVELSKLFEEAINLIPSDVRKQVHIALDESMRSLKPVMVHRVALLQVFQNILINGAESLTQSKPLYAKMEIVSEIEKVEGVEMVNICITDNGEGIAPEKINKIFERGVSSKRKGLSGIGLHWCANTISAMGGRIWAESKGEKCGACFHIILPMSCQAVNSFSKGK